MAVDTFFNELKRLILSKPKIPSVISDSEDCDFGNYLYHSKNLYYSFDSARCTNSFYLFDSFICDSCGDCDYAVESQLCYESVDAIKCFNSDYLDYCGEVRDSSYCYNCTNSSNLFGCVNLENKSYCIFNRQLTEAEYNLLVPKLKKLPPEQILKMVEDLKKRFPLTQTIGSSNDNTDYGNYIHNDKNCYLCFDAAYDEDCAYLYDSFHNKSSMDMTYTSQEAELCYEIVDSGWLFNCSFCVDTYNSNEGLYLFNCKNVKNSIGCVGLKNKEYCILNRQLSPEDFEKYKNYLLPLLKEANIGWNDLVY